MSFRRPDPPADRAESERLLDAARGGHAPTPDADPLAHLLAAAAAPARPGELSGEEQALAAFRAARAAPAPAPARVSTRPRLRVGLAAWLAGLAATATAGVAFAAVSLDRPHEPAPPPAPTTPGGSGTSGAQSPSSATTGAGSPTGDPSPTPSAGAPGRPTAGQLTGQCRSYLAKPAGQRAQALEMPAFAGLVDAAGGADRVDEYCRTLVPEKSPRPSAGAGDNEAPTAAPPPSRGRKPDTGKAS